MYLKQRILKHLLLFLGYLCEFVVAELHSKDYCTWEIFKPSCADNEVVIMQKAMFGIMEKGRCIKRDYGFLGCSSDQLGYMDSKCSGQITCNVALGDEEIKSRLTCPDYYMEADYTCQKVTTVPMDQCHQSHKVGVKYTPAYLASSTTRQTGCGLGNMPWELQAQSGQKINLTLIDFGWGTESSAQNTKCPRLYGHILRYDNGEVVDICGGHEREKRFDLVLTHRVQVVLQDTAVHTYSFIIKFEAIGCPDIIPPKNAWMTKNDNDVTIGCHSSADNWKLKCVGNHWIGVVGNCSQVKEPPMKIEKKEFSHHHVFAVAVGCLALIICCVTITIGGYFIKRYKIKVKYKCTTTTSSDMYLLPSRQNTVTMRTLTKPSHPGSMRNNPTNPTHPELQGLHMCGPNCNCTMNNREQQKEYTDDSVLYYVLEPPIYANNSENVNG